MNTNILFDNTEKIYAILIAKHPNGTGTVHFVTAPDSISETVEKIANLYPDCKIRVFEHGWQRDYFHGILDRMW